MKQVFAVLAGVLIASSAWAGTAYFGGFPGETGTLAFTPAMYTASGYTSVPSNQIYNGMTANGNGKWTIQSRMGKVSGMIFGTTPTDLTVWDRNAAFSVPDTNPTVGNKAWTATYTFKLKSVSEAINQAPGSWATNSAIWFRTEPNKIAMKNAGSQKNNDNMKIGMGFQISGSIWTLVDDIGISGASAISLDGNAHLVKIVLEKTWTAADLTTYPILAAYGFANGDPVGTVTCRYYIDGVDRGLWVFGSGTTQRNTAGTAVFLPKDLMAANQPMATNVNDTVVPNPVVDATMTQADMADIFVITSRGFATEWVDPTITGPYVPDMNTASIDYDQDGIPSETEVVLGLNAAVSNVNVDTDGDGVMDVTEYQNGMNLLSGNTYGDGFGDKIHWSLGQFGVISSGALPVAGFLGLGLLGLGLATAGVRRIRK